MNEGDSEGQDSENGVPGCQGKIRGKAGSLMLDGETKINISKDTLTKWVDF